MVAGSVDLLFWASSSTDPATIHHVAMYLGGGMMLAAPHSGDVIRIQPGYMAGFFGAVRTGVLARCHPSLGAEDLGQPGRCGSVDQPIPPGQGCGHRGGVPLRAGRGGAWTTRIRVDHQHVVDPVMPLSLI